MARSSNRNANALNIKTSALLLITYISIVLPELCLWDKSDVQFVVFEKNIICEKATARVKSIHDAVILCLKMYKGDINI